MVFDKIYKDLIEEIDTYSYRFRNCLSWYKNTDESEKKFRASLLENARFWLDRRNECVRKLNKMRSNKEQIFDEWTFPY
jgi:hypothetical protein